MEKDKGGKAGFKLKKTKSRVLQNVILAMPMVEEITKQNVLPACLIGYSVNQVGKIHCYISTISDDKDTLKVLVEICEQFVKSQTKTK